MQTLSTISSNKSASFITYLDKHALDSQAYAHIENTAKKYLAITTGQIRYAKVFEIYLPLNEQEKQQVTQYLADNLQYEFKEFSDFTSEAPSTLLISKHPGVTDDEGVSAQKSCQDMFPHLKEMKQQHVYSHQVYFFSNKLSELELKTIGSKLLGNPLIHQFSFNLDKLLHAPKPEIAKNTTNEMCYLPLGKHRSDWIELSQRRHLGLSLEELTAINSYYEQSQIQQQRKSMGLQKDPTDCELEIFAQTWSEHCKHKEFNADICDTDLDTGETRNISSLFKSRIQAATALIKKRFAKERNDFLLKVFSDNAGVVKINESSAFVWKVETHNTPSALDPYGGAITGILGNNRDAFGTGKGGARPIFNTNCLCFGPYHPEIAAPAGAHHPSYIMQGVVAGIRDGGNKSGIPTVNGSVVFDPRFSGKPLVFCGTGALMPLKIGKEDSWEKPIAVGDWIIMAGGRIGKDGLHGATLSSQQLDEDVPQSMVQIGSPFTQKRLSDFLLEAVQTELVKTCTDNGAGGLSSSVGEMATATGGACVEISKLPLKFGGLKPWEIFLSESQERMSLVIDKSYWPALKELANKHEVELSHLGHFTNDQTLQVNYDGKAIAYLDLDFLHNGVPKKKLESFWKKPKSKSVELPKELDLNRIIKQLLSSLNICSRASIIRQYDHEVQGQSIIKPLMGPQQRAPQDAAVLRVDFESYQGLAVSNGLCPRYGDLDPYQMAAGAFDEAVRQIISVGGKLPDPKDPNTSVWSVNDNFCLPNVVYDPQSNPDGHLKLAKLVRMCDALYDQSVFFNIPMTSGKDSMKNDYHYQDTKISIPPTLLFSMVSTISDVRQTISSEFKMPGDLIYLVGQTYDELGASEFYQLFGKLGQNVPIVRPQDSKRIYEKMSQAHKAKFFTSSHDLSDGGLLVALAESAIGANLGAQLTLDPEGIELISYLCSESHSRFIISIPPTEQAAFESLFAKDASLLGYVSADPVLSISHKNQKVLECSVEELNEAWQKPLANFGGLQ